ncbi:sensor histidine kinase [Humibacter sp.]|uniref:sensor histidine kinase n=1 Tax=Humibacter sp. TaxID=1940291 RepID=UPI003F822E0C
MNAIFARLRLRISARTRLTLLYTGLFLVCGAALIAVMYVLVLQFPVASGSSLSPTELNSQIQRCEHEQTLKGPIPPDAKKKCIALYSDAAQAGAAAQRVATLDNLLLYSLLTLGCMTVLAAVLGWFVAGRILRPVHQLTAAARQATEHTLSARLALQGRHDELRELADTFDDMLDRLDRAFGAQRQFIANAGHELRTPLTVMRTSIDVFLAKEHPTADETATMCTEVRRAVDGAERLIDALLTLARNEQAPAGAEPLDLAVIVEDCIDDRAGREPTPTLRLHDAPVVGDRVLLERLVGNLLDNAERYNVPEGTITVTTGIDGDTALLGVSNTGPQIPSGDVERLFLPFTRRDDRIGHEGFGLGLALVRSITAAHGGTVTATARREGGLDVEVRLPTPDHSARLAATESSTSASPSSSTVPVTSSASAFTSSGA